MVKSIFILTSILLAICLSKSSAQIPNTETITIRGTILGEDQYPLYNAFVRVYDSTEPIAGTASDQNGRFSVGPFTGSNISLLIEYKNGGYQNCELFNLQESSDSLTIVLSEAPPEKEVITENCIIRPIYPDK